MDSLEDIQERCCHLYQRVKAAYGPRVQEAWVAFVQYSETHPYMTMFFITTLIMCVLPMILFLCFAITTVLVTFIGFVFVEGTLLTVGTVILTLAVAVVGILAFTLVALVAASWVTFSAAYKMLEQTKRRFRGNENVPSSSSSPRRRSSPECSSDGPTVDGDWEKVK
ncbi:PREDICTED: uncharacterized protein LOC106812166 isoform X3 [Priapulus caudatus]|nr:PREDICTED: uncharacterized protein LOC106812166 isoform X3 [Priapulus caudatus]XP_014671469.1 PREDICTED: uncharacterized protein LOC106812166 isoform X3 [Priapulus caudatus]XP_014671470.1 PREDICTED: uncharacterized protein LOC106812166 isoform X3 [Priapulus caudatus]